MRQMKIFAEATPLAQAAPTGRRANRTRNADDRRAPIDHRWQAFRKAHPKVFDRALSIARADLSDGARRITVASIWERMRGRIGAPLDNSLRAPLARALVTADPRLRGHIEMRQRRSA